MKALIIEDDLNWLNRILNITQEKLPECIIDISDSINDTLNIKYYNLFILDIEAKDKNGIDLGLRIKEENPQASIIYVSAYYTYLTQGLQNKSHCLCVKR